MPSGRAWGTLVVALAGIAVLVALALDPNLATAPASGLSQFSAYWDSYMASVAFPVAVYYGIVWDAGAQRAKNPVTGRFISHAIVVVVALVLLIVCFLLVTYVVIPQVYLDFLAYSTGSGYAPVASLFVQLALIVAIPFICVAIAYPPGLSRTFRSYRRNW